MNPLLEVDLTPDIAFPSPKAFELAAYTQDENDICAYMPGRFITKMKQRVENISLDLLTPIHPHTESALQHTEDEDPNLGLLQASAIALAGQGSPEDKACKAARHFYGTLANTYCLVRLETALHTEDYSVLETSSHSGFPSGKNRDPRLIAEHLKLTPSGRIKALLRQH